MISKDSLTQWKISDTSATFHRSNILNKKSIFLQRKDQLIPSQLHRKIQGNGAATMIEGAISY